MYSNKVKKGKHCITYTLQLGAQSAPCRLPQLHLGMLTCTCLLRSLSRLGPDGSNCNFLVNALFHTNVPYLILNVWTKLQCHTFFPSQDIKQNELFKFLFKQLMTP